MRIALVTDGIYPYVTGGMQRHSFLLCKYLSENHKIDLYHYITDGVHQPISELFPETHQHINEHVFSYADTNNFPFHYLLAQKQYSNEVYRTFCSNEQTDLIICKGFTGWKFLREKKAGRLFAPILLNFHGLEMFQTAFTIREKIIQYVFRKLVRRHLISADYCFSYGGGITRLIKNRIDIPDQKIIEFPACVESQQIRNKTPKNSYEKIHFCFVGRFERRKGILELNQALLNLGSFDDFVFHFIGDIPIEHQLKKSSIVYYGKKNSLVHINSVLDNCDVLVCPSWSEGMPNVILEAMSRGLAVAATSVGAVDLLVNSSTGWIIEGNSVSNIQNTLSEIIATPSVQIYEKKINSIKHVSDNFVWGKKIRELEIVLKKIYDKKRNAA